MFLVCLNVYTFSTFSRNHNSIASQGGKKLSDHDTDTDSDTNFKAGTESDNGTNASDWKYT